MGDSVLGCVLFTREDQELDWGKVGPSSVMGLYGAGSLAVLAMFLLVKVILVLPRDGRGTLVLWLAAWAADLEYKKSYNYTLILFSNIKWCISAW